MIAMDATETRRDSGLESLVLMLRFLGLPADAAQIRHQIGAAAIGTLEMLRCAKAFKLKARAVDSSWERLGRIQLPAIAERRDGSFFILARVVEGKALIHDPILGRPQVLGRDELMLLWGGRLVLLARRASLGELARRFDVSWFLQAIHKYRYLLTEVLVASFFLQLFALVTPLFFQVVTDKVLVHRGLTTLDVLVIGLITISLFETVLGALRTYVFAHTTNRIDVELGARLFRHLVALPLRISRRGAPATASRACASSRTSATSSRARRSPSSSTSSSPSSSWR